MCERKPAGGDRLPETGAVHAAAGANPRTVYTKEQLKEISFPLGGIGTGCIGLAGNGSLKDWEIFNRPDKGSDNGFSHFAIKAVRGEETVDARVLCADDNGNLTGEFAHGFGAASNGTSTSAANRPGVSLLPIGIKLSFK